MKPGEIIYRGTAKNGKEFFIRYLKEGDEQQMTDYINILSKEQTFIYIQGENISLAKEKKYLKDQLKKIKTKQAVQLAVFADQTLIGLSGIELRDRAEKHVGSFGISLAKKHRGQGIGKLLMNLVLQEAEKNISNLHIITIGVFANNPRALSMYEKFGFIRHGSLPKGLLHRGKYIDHHYMHKIIRE